MKDFRGQELEIGDLVVFIFRSQTFANLAIGKVREFKRNCAYVDWKYEEDGDWEKYWKGLTSVSIMKLDGIQINEGL
jgi:hypothetical protein